jgi:hypothetical protein
MDTQKPDETIQKWAARFIVYWAVFWSVFGPLSFLVWLDLVNAWPFN